MLCLINPLAVAMDMLVLITAPWLLATLRNFLTFKFISVSSLPRFFSSNIFFGNRLSSVAWLISILCFDFNVRMVLSRRWNTFGFEILYRSRISIHRGIFPDLVAFFRREFLIRLSLVFSSEKPSTSLKTVSYSIMLRSVSLWRGIYHK